MKLVLIPRLLFLLLALTFTKDLLWSVMVPIWQTPDEQAHFAQLQYYAEKNSFHLSPLNLSQEVVISEQILGTLRDANGNNRFTYHPEYKIPYSNSFEGPGEETIRRLSPATRVQMVGSEAAGYPPLYYLLNIPLYNLGSRASLFDRLYLVRLSSILFHLLLVFWAYRLTKLIWGTSALSLSVATLVSFHPMVNFLAVGFHPDNLLNLLYTLAIFLAISLYDRFTWKKLILLLGVFILGWETKILMAFILPFAGALLVGKRSLLLGTLILLAPLLILLWAPPLPGVPQITGHSPLAGMTFWNYLHFRGPKLFFEIWPWYWGVFKWLGLTLPPLVLKIITRFTVLSLLGLVIYIFRRKFSPRIWFLLISAGSFLVYLIFWDFRLMQSIGYSQGLQGRYFFPNIVPHMALLLCGFLALGNVLHLKKPFLITGVLAMVALNLVALNTIAQSYYSLTNFSAQVSQYKPFIFKENGAIIISTLFFVLLLFYLYRFIREINVD